MRLVVVAVTLASLAIPASAQIAAPKRKAGYWEQTMTMQSPRAMTMTSQFCTDPSVEAKVSALGQAGPGQDCDAPKIARSAGGFTFESTCRIAGRTTHTKGVATGDFNSNYKLDMTSDAGGAPSRMQIASKWVGPCPAGKKPGDMVMPGGITVNIVTMAGRAPGR